MSKKQKLSKKIAHTLLAMSIVYSGGDECTLQYGFCGSS